MREIYLGLGSNLGDRLLNLTTCLNRLQESGLIDIIQLSPIYETEPVGVAEQPWFLNMVIEIETELTPPQLLRVTQATERQMGRIPTHRWGPRVIDIDILSFGKTILREPMLQIPHRMLHQRKFVLLPLRDIAVRFVHPELNREIDQLLAACQDRSRINLFMAVQELTGILNDGKAES
ncbi:MAG: 2-amino-4-hydroxy-6-hydroxymethyldihydropteridine diphosphokinase [candidate division KSB1 bacterium]|nr:2-amino-4-hydroxy-6-hydroxymethyldihydropteridine diphosphokinase [candidate division KSB1 bacterium]MDZ7333986.1 2-amino-4-hydroxy-6-hydroxymethyldihydropteridine diphosphokinase [candidate division KSB1 bacterium]MDZ7357974.1 2-amino-4-hydroxy-6-hydroxymethyldihydropteridine diphosphokinase [candidate division KSB1 bacterium]MDZ7399971.1 2-amino-4-hydroxy-6-hydroxymethyldihydropteridine diphosphokinase [candidate division KSB1 bacterium]